MWLKLGILVTGFCYAGLLPYSLRKTLSHTKIDLKSRTLSYLSNKHLYGRKYLMGYKWMLFAMSLLTLVFFRLLIDYYELHTNEALLSYIDYSFIFLLVLSFLPHNMQAASLKHLGRYMVRLLHNLMAVLVFLSLPALIITFQIALLDEMRLLAIIGLVLISVVVLTTLGSIVFYGVNGVTELLFINGISVWCLVVTAITLLI